jgi:hypothetical protein
VSARPAFAGVCDTKQTLSDTRMSSSSSSLLLPAAASDNLGYPRPTTPVLASTSSDTMPRMRTWHQRGLSAHAWGGEAGSPGLLGRRGNGRGAAAAAGAERGPRGRPPAPWRAAAALPSWPPGASCAAWQPASVRVPQQRATQTLHAYKGRASRTLIASRKM